MKNVKYAKQDPENETDYPPREWLNTEDAARYLSISPNALRVCVCRGQVQTYRLGSRLRFRLADLRRLILNSGSSVYQDIRPNTASGRWRR